MSSLNEIEKKAELMKFLDNNEYIKHLGIEILEMRQGYGKARMPYKNDVLNPYMSIHGGVLYSFADIVAGTTAAMEGQFATTVNGNMNFLEPAMNTEYITCEAKCVRSGRNLVVYNVEIRDDENKLLDDGSFTFYKTKLKVLENNKTEK